MSVHEHHGPAGELVRHRHEGGAEAHEHEAHPGWVWSGRRSYVTRRPVQLTDDQAAAVAAAVEAHRAWEVAPADVERIRARRRAIAAALDAGATTTATAAALGLSRAQVHRLAVAARR